MIAIIPALNFMRSLCGSYRSEPVATLRIWACGYGIAMDLAEEGQTLWVCVFGACGDCLDCFGQFGLPYVLRLTGQLTSKTAMGFECDDLSLTVSIVRHAEGLHLAMAVQGNERAAYNFIAA